MEDELGRIRERMYSQGETLRYKESVIRQQNALILEGLSVIKDLTKKCAELEKRRGLPPYVGAR